MLGFRRFGVSFELVFHSDCIQQEKRNAVPMQTGVRFFGRAKTNYIIAKYVYTRRFAFSVVRDRLFLEVLILDWARPVWSGCEMTCFCLYIAGTIWFILFTNSLGFWMLTVGTAIFHKTLAIFWSHLLTLLFPVATNSSSCNQRRSKLKQWNRTLKPRPIRVSQN